jgi:hypothetical protein
VPRLGDARTLVNAVRYRHLPEFRRRDREDVARRDRFLAFVRSAAGDPAVARELEDFLSLQCGTAGRAARVEAVLRELDRQLGGLFHEMDEYNADFEALEQVERHPQAYSPAELDELRCLLGLYGVETEKRLPPGRASLGYVGERQQAWNEARWRARDPARQQVAERAVACYGLILHELLKGGPGSSSQA